tara:strand:- start:3887 stop:5035 length:1149 start_codon:yes stop_codon:yes gene_type:complete
MLKYFLLIFISLTSLKVFSYPNFIGHGYNSCITCHYNPYGNGPLNDYGRALSATAISDRWIHDSNKSEEEIAKNSGFMYMKAFNSWLRPSVNYRGLKLVRNVNRPNEKTEYIHMMANVNTVVRFQNNDKYIASISYGYAPTPVAQKNEDVGNYRSREHYFGYRPNTNLGLYVGMMDKVFGIRVPDHIAFSRSVTELAQNDQTHGVMIHLIKNNFEIGIHSFIGSLFQKEDLRQKGISSKIEYNYSSTVKPGFSVLKSSSDHVESSLFSIHGKFGISKGSSILVELGQKLQEIVSTKKETSSRYVFLQNHILLRRGTYFLTTAEYFQPNIEKESETMRVGPGLQYFLVQGLELRFDLYNTKNFSPDAATKDAWDFTGQIHLWF